MGLREKFLEDIEQYSDVSSIIHTYFKLENTLKFMKQQNLRLPANQNMDDEQYIIEQEILESDATVEQIICENFDWILTKVMEKDDVLSFANVINMYYPDCSVVFENFRKIVSALEREENLKDLRDFYAWILTRTNGDKVFSDNIDFILEQKYPETIIDFLGFIKGRNPELDMKLNDVLRNHANGIARVMLQEVSENPRIEDYVKTLEIMTAETLRSEEKDYSDIERIAVGTGDFSNIYKIGNKILKVGAPRGEFEIPNHRRILQPIVRKSFKDENGDSLACVEITQRVDTDIQKSVSKEDVYEVWKELRDAGIIWTDATIENVGRLLSRNVPTLNGEEMYVEPESAGLIGKNNGSPLERGQLVVIDTDYVFFANERDVRWLSFGFAKEFEKRYEKEMKEKQVEELKKEFLTANIHNNIKKREIDEER